MKRSIYDDLPHGFGLKFLPCIRGTKQPARGCEYRCATDAEDTLKRWFGPDGTHRTSNVAVMCGRESGILVIDVENLRGEALLKQLGGCPLAPKIDTGGARCGYHLWVQYPDVDFPLKGVSYWRAGPLVTDPMLLEIRSNRHLALVPPSVIIERVPGKPPLIRQRTWARDGGGEMAPWTIPIPPAPDWVVDALREPAREPYVPQPITGDKAGYVGAAISGEINVLLGSGPGTRNHTLNLCAFSLFRPELMQAGADPLAIRDELLRAWLSMKPGCEHEGRNTIQSAAKARGVRL